MFKRDRYNRACRHSFLLAVFSILMAATPSTAFSFEILLGTDQADSFSYFAGKAVCRIIDKADNGLTCRPVPSGSYADNLTNIQNGSLDMALVNSKVIYDAYHGTGLFRFVSLDYTQLRLLAPLYRMPISLVVRKDAKIFSLDDLAGKRVNIGPPLSLRETVFKELMSAMNWRSTSFSLLQRLSDDNAQDLIAMQTGSIQAMLHIGMHPDKRIVNSMDSKKTDVVGINGETPSRLIDSNAGFYRKVIPAETYPGQKTEIETLALETYLVAAADIENETVEQVLDAIFSARLKLQYAHPSFLKEQISIETLNENYIHPHPEAILFFQANKGRL